MPVDPERLEQAIDRVVLADTDVSLGFGGVKFTKLIELTEFGKLMARSGVAVPVHCRDEPGVCLGICTKAARFGFDPYALAEHSYVTTKNEKVGNDWIEIPSLAFDSFVIRAIIAAHAPIIGRLKYTYDGEGEARTCTVTATPMGTTEPLSHTSPPLGELTKARGRNDKGKIKGSPLWDTKPDQQLAYDTGRDWCRKHFPEILLGWYDKDEFEENVRAATATDITPGAALRDRLGKSGDGGFSPHNVDRALEHKPGATVPTATRAKSPEPVRKDDMPDIPSDLDRRQKRAPKTAPAEEAAKPEPVKVTAKAEPKPEPAAEPEPEPETVRETVEDEDAPPSEAYMAARETVDNLIAQVGDNGIDLDEFKKRGRATIDSLDGLAEDERDVLRGEFTTAVLTAQRRKKRK